DSSANSLINPDARMGLAGAQPGAAAAGAGQPGGNADLGGLGGGLGGNFGQRLSGLAQMRGNPRAPLIFAVALLVAIVAGLFLWSRAPDYKVLYSNLSDRDGGAIITALQQANIPYKFSEAGGAILVPSEQVHEMRLRLASQGLPKSGSVGFELMDNQKFGISQFAEQINYQRALEGELERTIESVSSVKSARVHLAIPKPSVFVRDKEAPSASVLVNLYPGRALDEGQVLAITHMVSSAVPEMPVKGVTILDQDGNLLTQPSVGGGLDASQLKYRQQIERSTQQRIDAILAPLFGSGNAHSQVSADIDFSRSEQTSENYGPNGNPQQAAIRSQQSSTATEMSQGGASGVPGALSNQPPQPASAPINAPAGASGGVTTTPVSDRKDMTTNYELDKTVRHL
ncbi:MAG: flagellar M-ring protein FliF, partial [Burkholderia sp.]|nr:flagellar M-ring protein FliF [Burkholderia sp.]